MSSTANEAGRIFLTEAARLVVLQFRFNNEKQIPAILRKRPRLEPEERVKGRKSGELAIAPIPSVAPDGGLLGFLKVAGYELVDAFCKAKTDGSNPDWLKEFSVAQFVLVRKEHAEVADDFKEVRDAISGSEFPAIAESAMWRTRAYLNPFYKNGEEVEGLSAISVNFDARLPYLSADGKPMLVGPRDSRGERIPDAPTIPLKADLQLVVEFGDQNADLVIRPSE